MKNTKRTPFADNVFDDGKMKRLLPRSTYNAVVAAREELRDVPEEEREIYARALGKWAVSKGAVRYSHWFCPLSKNAAGKSDSLLSANENGFALKFGAKELCGEADASSFPSGGMRKTSEARGITRWDATGYPFVKDGCLYVPCTFWGAKGEALDEKTPLLRSCKALDRQAVRVLKAMGEQVGHVWSTVGAEQEYFLVDKELFERRADLVYTGRTLFGAPPEKGQQADCHYFRPPDAKTARFMQKVNEELRKLGAVVKTEHNEVAPHQLELALCYSRANVASDLDKITAEILRQTAEETGFACLLHEKPFDCVNGSGKHNNWSLATDSGVNLLEAGETPLQNARFLLMLAAVIKAADDYSELLQCSVSSRGNDCRLGGFEAPPRVLSVFLGAPLTKAISIATNGKWRYGVDILPNIYDNTDRNRTSPFAFTGNKFEFRSAGSNTSVAQVNTALNVAVAESLRQFADRLERSTDVMKSVGEIVGECFAAHKRVLFDGDCYSERWAREAELRGLKKTDCVESADALCNARNLNVLERHGVLNRKETSAHRQILLENYVNAVLVEGKTAVEICNKYILCAGEEYLRTLFETEKAARDCKQCRIAEKERRETVARLTGEIRARLYKLQKQLKKSETIDGIERQARYCRDSIVATLNKLRVPTDRLEALCPKEIWKLPTYGQMLFDCK